MKRIATCVAATAALSWAGQLRAHHSISWIDITTPVWVKGTVVQYEPISPHAMLVVDVRGAGGTVQRWTLQGPAPGRLERYHLARDFLKPGDLIEACGFVPKPQPEKSWPPERFIHSQLLLMPDGQMQLWGPYGKLENCVRPTDSPQRWLQFLENPMARDLWCNSYTAAIPLSPLASEPLVDEINGELAQRCH
jgi:uncharacterized protein DUF6152